MPLHLLPFTLLLALAACSGGAGNEHGRGDSSNGRVSERAVDTARRHPPRGGITDTHFRSRGDSLRIRPPERYTPPPPLDRPLGVPPSDSDTAKRRDTTDRGR